jgi:DNA-binding CsgD family transcriptional regulator
VQIARTSGDETDYVRTLELMDWRTRDETIELLRLIEAWREAGPKIHGLSIVVRSLALQHGDLAETVRVAGRLLEVSEAAGSVSGQAYALSYIAYALRSQGDLATAIETDARSLALVDRLGPAHRVRRVRGYQWKLLNETPADWRRAGGLAWDQAIDPANPPWMGLVQAAYAASAFALAGDVFEARRALESVLPAITASEPSRLNQNGAVAAATEAIWMLGDVGPAVGLQDAALELIDAGVGSFWGTSLELSVALTSALLGDLERAREYFERARSDVAARGARPTEALVDFHEALALIRTGLPGAAPLLARARERLEDLGMSFWLRQADELAERIHPRDALPDGITMREAEVLRLLAAGRTNREIADELVISVHTVERHLANAYRKIGARNRSEATAYALSAGLS